MAIGGILVLYLFPAPTKFKLVVYDAVLRANLMYGLEPLQLNEDLKEKLMFSKEKALGK